MRHKMFKTWLTLFSQPFLGLGEGREGEEGLSTLHCIPKTAFVGHLAVEAGRESCIHMPHPLYIESADVSSNRTRRWQFLC